MTSLNTLLALTAAAAATGAGVLIAHQLEAWFCDRHEPGQP
jgi:hypothetical protein